MILHWISQRTISPIKGIQLTNEDEQVIQQFIEHNHVSELQFWTFIKKNDLAHKARLETKTEQALSNLFKLPVECIFVQHTTDIEVAIVEVDRYMHWLAMHEPLQPMGMFMTQTDILSQAVLIEGVKTFSHRFHSLYHNTTQQYEESPYQAEWLQLFKSFVHEFDYQSAYDMLADIPVDTTRIAHLLKMQLARLNFDFEVAIQESAAVDMPNNLYFFQTQTLLKNLHSEDSQERALAQITELYRHIKVMLIKKDWASFLTRFYRAREAVMHYLMTYCAQQEISKRMSTIYDLVDELEDAYETGAAQKYYGAYFYTKSANVANTLNSRNKSFLGHNRAPINVSDILENYYGAKAKSSQMPERFLADSHIMLRELGSGLDTNMEKINTLIIDETTRTLEVLV